MNKIATLFILALLTVSSAQGEVSAKKKVIEAEVDTLQLLIQAGDSCMEQFNTLEAVKHYQQAFAMKDTADVRMKLANCYYKRGNYRQTADLLKNVRAGDLSHEAFRQLCYSYQKMGDNDSFVFWTSNLVLRFPMDGEMVAGLTIALAKEDQAWKGIGYGESYFKEDSTNILVNRALGDAYFMDRKFDKAAAMYERLLQQGDSTFNTLYSAGMCYTRIDSLNHAYKCLIPAFLLSGMQHAGCAYRLGVVSVDLGSYEEGLGYLDLATKMMQPDTIVMKAITLSQGEGFYMTKQYDKAIEAWKRHLEYNPGSIATYYNIASAYYYFCSDGLLSKAYLEKFLDVARKEEKPTQQLKDMIDKAETLLRTTNFNSSRKTKTK